MMAASSNDAETIETTELSDLILENLPNELLNQSDTLTHLIAARNLLASLPEWIACFSRLTYLDVNGNRLETLPSEICQLPSLVTLKLKNNHLTSDSLPKNMGMLTRLEVLDLGGNQFVRIAPQILSLTTLRELYLGGNQIRELSCQINQLSKLEILYLGGNSIQHVPAEVGLLSSLTYLSLADNGLETLPTTMGNLNNLRSLNLHGNQLHTLPQEIVQLDKLVELSLRDNPLVVKFVRDFEWEVPTLLELAGRVILANKIPHTREYLPDELVDYLSSSHECVNPQCRGVYFSSRVEHVKFVDFCGKYRIPLLQYICSPRCTDIPRASSNEAHDLKVRRVLLG